MPTIIKKKSFVAMAGFLGFCVQSTPLVAGEHSFPIRVRGENSFSSLSNSSPPGDAGVGAGEASLLAGLAGAFWAEAPFRNPIDALFRTELGCDVCCALG